MPDGVIAITKMFINVLKWTLMNTIERYKARGVVYEFVEISDVHFNPDAAHAHVASDSSLLVMISLVVKHDPYFKQLDVKTAFLSSPLTQEVWVWLPDG